MLQHVHSNYEIDLFQHLIKAAARETKTSDLNSPSLKVLADHIRACSFLIADGVIPGNEGRGYVLRRIIRRAIRHGYKLGARAAFFYRLVPDLVKEMGDAYSELKESQARIADVLRQEEDRFFATIEHGMSILLNAISSVRIVSAEDQIFFEEKQHSGVLDGNIAFLLHDTYGFPLDLTADVCREHGVKVDTNTFDAAMDRQREQARAAGKFKMAAGLEYAGVATAFRGYEQLEVAGAKIAALYRDGAAVQQLRDGEQGVVVLDQTPFYAESGGQVGDSGELIAGNVCTTLFAVADTQKIQADVFGHHGELRAGSLKVGDVVTARVDTERRAATMRNHSATHLLHKALREVLGAHVQQKGSLVDAAKTRFDFAHNAPLGKDEIRQIEFIVNREIVANAATQARVMPIDEAQKTGAMMLFGEKYGDEVRVLDIGSSRELCGGTHVARTGDIGLFKVLSESGVAAGVRRVEAVTGMGALGFVHHQETLLHEIAGALKSSVDEAAQRVAQVLDNSRALEKELAQAKGKLASAAGSDLVGRAKSIGGINVLAVRIDGADAKTLRDTVDQLKNKLDPAVVLLASVDGDKVLLAAGVSQSLTGRFKAGELLARAAAVVGGKGGGRPDFAQGGGTNPAALAQALALAEQYVAG